MAIEIKIVYKLIAQFTTLVALLICSTAATANIYKWVDKDGKIHYGQQRPTNISSKRLKVQQYAPQDVSSYKRPGTSPSNQKNTAQEAQKNTSAKKPKISKAEKKRRLEGCLLARKNLQRMKSVGRIRSRDKDGNTSFLSQKEKLSRMKNAQNIINKACK